VNLVQRKAAAGAGACAAAVLLLGVLVPAAFIGVPAAAGGVAGPAMPGHIVLAQAAPVLPAGSTRLGSAPASDVLDLDVALAGQNPSGLAQAVAAVSTPGSPDYRHYLTGAQYAADYGPSAGEVAQVSSALRSEGLTVGSPDPGSTLLPVSGTASVVSAALGTPLESVQAPGDAARAIVNTASPQIPASLEGVVTGVVGLDGLVTQHSMIKQGHPGASGPSGASGSSGSSRAPGTTQSPEAQAPASGSPAQTPAAISHVGTPQACPAAQGTAFGGTYTSTQLASIFGLDQLLGQGRTGIGQSIAIVEFEQYATSDFAAFQACYGLSNPIRNVSIDGGPGGSPQGRDGEAALDTELAAVNAPSASLVVYEAPNNGDDSQALDLFSRIASDDSSQVVTTSWGVCEAEMPSSDRQTENGIFQRMALQGQTVIAASGDAGSEDCYSASGAPTQTQLAIDDPGSQPDVVSAGGTSMTSASALSQSVWNDCMDAGASCARNSSLGAAGGGYSIEWPANPGQPAATGLDTTPCNLSTCRAVPDFSFPSDPTAGGVAAYWSGRWTGFGGTSVAAPTNAGLFVDTNQGCFGQLGRVGPALYAAQQGNASTFTDITQGNNDFTNTNLEAFSAGIGFDAASGLGTPVDPNLTQALQGADGCPSVAAVSPNTGPTIGAGAITIFGGGFANASSVTFGPVGQGRIVARSATSITVVPPNASSAQCVDVTVGNSQGISAQSVADHYGFGGNLNCGQGYRFVASDGGIFTFGDAGFYGSAGGSPLNAPVVGMADTPSSNGYWLVATDGGIFTYGDARFFGSMGGQHLNKPIVGMAATPDGGGYWLVASDGGIFSFGDAQFYGSTGGMSLNKPIVGMASTSDGNGYWLVASDGGIFAYGDAQFFGSTGSIQLNSPVVDMAAGPGGNGYWLVAADGGIFNYGSANFFGSAGSLHLNKPVVGMAATPNGQGYWLVASDGGIFTYGNTLFYGSTGGMQLNKPIVGMSSA
jgi:Pro-kumamolisin, activation domain/IPT/TIG domain